MALLVLLAGAPIAPLITTRNELISHAAPQGTGTEAFTWLMTALIAGLSLGTAIGGAVIEAAGWPEAVLVGVAVGGAGAVDPAFARRGTLRPAAGHRPDGPTLARMDLELLERTLAERGEPGYRADQVWEWAAAGRGAYEEMTNLPAALREGLADWRSPTRPSSSSARRARRTARSKALFRTADGRPIEAVLMRYRDGRRSICVSSQSGCPLTCTFCATGQMKFGRNLTAAEIVDQALHFRRLVPSTTACSWGWASR